MDIRKVVSEFLKDTCIVNTLHHAVCAHKCLGCGNCVFGYEGATQLQLILKDMTEKKSHNDDIERISMLCEQMKKQVICEDGIVLADAVLFTLSGYQRDFLLHLNKKECRAGVCSKFITYHILANKCTGCGDCLDECEEDAILGKKRFVHVIDQDECIQCGNCFETCDEEAIVKAGAQKPRCPPKPTPCKR
jgi:ferredoxin